MFHSKNGMCTICDEPTYLYTEAQCTQNIDNNNNIFGVGMVVGLTMSVLSVIFWIHIRTA